MTNRLIAIGWGLFLAVAAFCNDVDVAALLATARKGATVTLPAGTFQAGGLLLPEGVSLKGAGYGKTILDASGHENGLVSRGKRKASVSDLTIINSVQAGLFIDGAQALTIERVRVRRCGSALVINNATGCTFRNLVLADNKSGVSLVTSVNSALINATIANTDGTGIRVNGCNNVAIFNNIIANVPYGIAVGATNGKLVIDHNLYIANFVGQLQGETTRKKVESWHHLSGYDKHSLTIGVTFNDAAAGDYRPVSPLSWAPVRATSSDWGTKALGGFTAPKADIDGMKRIESIDLGAYEVSFPAPRAADGAITVKSGAGTTSAGIFTKENFLVRYLFQNLPLAKGTYRYWLPSRDWQGRPIAADAYLVKVTEADMRLDYLAAGGNGDLAMSTTQFGPPEKRVSLEPLTVTFDMAGRLLMAQSGFESWQHVRAYDPQMTRFLWSFPGGGGAVGMTVDAKDRVLTMRSSNNLLRLDSASGKGVPFADGSIVRIYPEITACNGMTMLNGAVYVANPLSSQLVKLAGEELDISGMFPLTAVKQPAADSRSGLIWALSGGEVVAVSEQGEIKHRATPVAQPQLLAANAGKLTVYDAATNKLYVYNCSDPGNLAMIRTIGTGGDGYGKIQGDRFWEPKSIAMNAAGEIAMIDGSRTILLGADGTVKRHHMAMWGQQMAYGEFADGLVHAFNMNQQWDIVFDAKNRRWDPGTRWRYTMPMNTHYFFFTIGGTNYGLYNISLSGIGHWLAVVRMEEDGTGRVLARYGWEQEGMYLQRDPDGDGVINLDDPKEPVFGPDGMRYTDNFQADRGFNNIDFRADGSIVHPKRSGVQIIRLKGVEQGVPLYDFANATYIPGTVEMTGTPNYISPYDFTTVEQVSIAEDIFLEKDGSFAGVISTASGPGPDLCTGHANSTNMAGFDAKGRMRWMSPMNPFGLKMGFYGITTIGGITFAGRGAICEYETMDHDGLGTGVLGMSKNFGWAGMWLDNARQTFGFTGNDGNPYLVTGDYMSQSYHWQELKGWEQVIHSTFPLTVTPTTAQLLATQEPLPVPIWPVTPPPRVAIKKLQAPLPIDGDPKKWRSLGIQPLVAISDNPTSNSCILRMAYEGDNIYVQAIKFDDLVTFHQHEPGKHFLQDGIEFALNSFMDGWKYNVTRLTGTGDAILRDRWGSGGLIGQDAAPRIITLYDNAVDFEERKIIEAATGLDMINSKVVYIEFKLTKEALANMPPHRQVVFESGKTFIFGFMINDNDIPGADIPNAMTWPVTYGTFEFDDRYATGIFE